MGDVPGTFRRLLRTNGEAPFSPAGLLGRSFFLAWRVMSGLGKSSLFGDLSYRDSLEQPRDVRFEGKIAKSFKIETAFVFVTFT